MSVYLRSWFKIKTVIKSRLRWQETTANGVTTRASWETLRTACDDVAVKPCTCTVSPRDVAELCVDALCPLKGTQRFIQPAIAATHRSVAPPLAVQHTTTRPHVLCDQEGLQTGNI